MKKIWELLEVLDRFLRRREYVITKMKSGIKYYYLGYEDRWTPLFEGAKKYQHKPEFVWITEDDYEIEGV